MQTPSHPTQILIHFFLSPPQNPSHSTPCEYHKRLGKSRAGGFVPGSWISSSFFIFTTRCPFPLLPLASPPLPSSIHTISHALFACNGYLTPTFRQPISAQYNSMVRRPDCIHQSQHVLVDPPLCFRQYPVPQIEHRFPYWALQTAHC